MSDTCTYIRDSGRARNDARRTITDFDLEADAIGSDRGAIAAIGAAARNGAPIPTTGYFASGRGLDGKAARPLNAYSERDILDLIRDAIGPHYPIGSASRWHKQATGIAEKRLAEGLASLVFDAAGDKPLACRVAISGAHAAARLAPAPLAELIAAGFAAAIDAIEREAAEVARRLDGIRVLRTRIALHEIAAQRRGMQGQARMLDHEAAALRRDVARDRRNFERDPDNPLLPRFRRVWAEVLSLDVPKIESRAAAIRAAMPSYRLTAGQRRRLAEFKGRLRRLRAAQRTLRRAFRAPRLAKSRPVPAA